MLNYWESLTIFVSCDDASTIDTGQGLFEQDVCLVQKSRIRGLDEVIHLMSIICGLGIFGPNLLESLLWRAKVRALLRMVGNRLRTQPDWCA